MPKSSTSPREHKCPWCEYTTTLGWEQRQDHVKCCPFTPAFKYQDDRDDRVTEPPRQSQLTPPQRLARTGRLNYILQSPVHTGANSRWTSETLSSSAASKEPEEPQQEEQQMEVEAPLPPPRTPPPPPLTPRYSRGNKSCMDDPLDLEAREVERIERDYREHQEQAAKGQKAQDATSDLPLESTSPSFATFRPPIRATPSYNSVTCNCGRSSCKSPVALDPPRITAPRPKCKCRCGCRQRPGRLIVCTGCGVEVGPGCCWDKNKGKMPSVQYTTTSTAAR